MNFFPISISNLNLPWFKKKEPVVSVSHPNVILVEDDPSDVLLARYGLEAEGFWVEHVKTGEDALTMLRRNGKQFPLVIIDLGLPGGMSGWKLREEIIKSHPGVKVVIITGSFDGFKNVSSIAGTLLRIILKSDNMQPAFRELKQWIV